MREWLRALRWLSLGGWLGSWALFALVIAPTAFRVLPPGNAASDLVSPVLRSLHLYGLAAGAVNFAISFLFRERTLLVALPGVLAVLCALTEFAVTPSISDVGPISGDSLGAEAPAEQFAQLHYLSRVLFTSILAGVAGLMVLHSREDQRTPQG